MFSKDKHLDFLGKLGEDWLYHDACPTSTCITTVSKVITKTFPWKPCLFQSTAGLTKGPVCVCMGYADPNLVFLISPVLDNAT